MPNDHSEVIVMLAGGSVIFLVLTGILIFILLFYQKKKFNHASQLLQIDKMHNETLLQSKIEIQEETFKNISQEIHDNIGQVLTFIKLNLNSLPLPQIQSDKEKLLESISLLSKSIRDLRDVARSINTDYVAQIGLCNAIRQQLTVLEKTGMFKVALHENGIPGALEKRDELILFRIIQELLNNIVKHAEATSIEVKIFYDIDKLRLSVADNGKGFDTHKIAMTTEAPHGLGLSNLHSRMILINGQLIINSTSGEGTIIVMELPWPK